MLGSSMLGYLTTKLCLSSVFDNTESMLSLIISANLKPWTKILQKLHRSGGPWGTCRMKETSWKHSHEIIPLKHKKWTVQQLITDNLILFALVKGFLISNGNNFITKLGILSCIYLWQSRAKYHWRDWQSANWWPQPGSDPPAESVRRVIKGIHFLLSAGGTSHMSTSSRLGATHAGSTQDTTRGKEEEK